MHLSVKVPIEYPIKAIHIKVNSTIQAAKVELITISDNTRNYIKSCIRNPIPIGFFFYSSTE